MVQKKRAEKEHIFKGWKKTRFFVTLRMTTNLFNGINGIFE